MADDHGWMRADPTVGANPPGTWGQIERGPGDLLADDNYQRLSR